MQALYAYISVCAHILLFIFKRVFVGFQLLYSFAVAVLNMRACAIWFCLEMVLFLNAAIIIWYRLLL